MFIACIILGLLTFAGSCGTQREKKDKSRTINISPSGEPLLDILFLANLNGNIENCKCGDPPLGGLGRIATIIKEWRKKNQGTIFIDGGDTFNTYPFKELNKAVVQAFSIIKPDVWLLSEQEFIDGRTFLIKNLDNELRQHIITSNYTVRGIQSKKSLFIEDKNVLVLTFLEPLIWQNAGLKDDFFNDNDTFQKLIQKHKEALKILVFHGQMSQDKIQREFKYFDLIFIAHDQDLEINTNESPAIVGGLADGENLIHIAVFKNNDSYLFIRDLIPVKLSIRPDKKVLSVIELYKREISKQGG